MTSPKDADSARELSKIIGAALERHTRDLVAMTVTGTAKCAVCGLEIKQEGPHTERVNDEAYFKQCRHIPEAQDLGCPHLIEAQRRLSRLAEDARRAQESARR